MPSMTEEERDRNLAAARREQARIAAEAEWGRLLRAADPEGQLPEHERIRRAKELQRAKLAAGGTTSGRRRRLTREINDRLINDLIDIIEAANRAIDRARLAQDDDA